MDITAAGNAGSGKPDFTGQDIYIEAVSLQQKGCFVMKMKKGRKLISMLMLLTFMVSALATSVHAADVSRVGQGKVGSVSQSYTGGSSQVYAHRITKADGTEVRYVYSKNYLNAPGSDGVEDSFAVLKSVLTADYAALIPDKVDESRAGMVGFFFCSDPSLEKYVNDNWTSAEYVARNFLTVKKEGTSYTYKCEGERAGGAINTSATAARQSNRFELIKTLAENANKARWEAREAERKAAWDASEAEEKEKDPDYIPQEYQPSTYVELDFGELTGDDIQGKRDITDSQIDLAVGCNLTAGYEFVSGKLVEVNNIEIVDHVADIYSEHATISESESQAATVKKEPKAKSVTYTGSAQKLVTAGTAEGGTMQYALGTDATTAPTTGYTASIPTGTDAGTYYVWYKAVGDASHTDSEAACVSVIVDPADAVPATVTGNTVTFGETPQALVTVEGEAVGGTMQYALGSKTEAQDDYSEAIPTTDDVGAYGTYYIWYKAVGDSNHNDSAPACVMATVSEEELIDLTDAEIAVDPAKRTVTVTLEGKAVPAEGYRLIFFTYTPIEGGESLTRVGTEFPAAPGSYIAAIVGNEESGYTGQARSPVFTLDGETFTVSFDTGGGKPVPEDQLVPAGGYAERPETDPKKDGYDFDGWIEGGETGAAFDFDTYKITEDTVVYALWKEAEETGSGREAAVKHKVSIVEADGGEVKAGSKTAYEFDRVKLTVTPGKGYELASITVTDEYGSKLKLKENSDGSWSFRMSDCDVTVKAVFTKAEKPEAEPDPKQPEIPFGDVTPDMPCYEDVKYVYDKGIMIGVGTEEFGPELSLSRGMIVTVLYRLEGEPAAEFKGVFDDVPAGKWYSDAVEWAAARGIVEGYGDGTFGQKDDLTRQQLAVILYRYAIYKGYAVETAALEAPDADEIADWAAEAMAWAAANGILTADEDGSVRPTEKATRAEIAAAIRAFDENVAK